MAFINSDRVKETSTTTGTGNMTLDGAVSGFVTFDDVMANNDTCFYCITDGLDFEIGLGTFVSATPALARTTVIRSTNSNAAVSFPAGDKQIFITNLAERLPLPEMSSDPPAPASSLLLYSRALAGRSVPRFIGPSGLDSALQPAMFANNVTMWCPGTGTTASIAFGVSWTIATTQDHPTIATTNFMTSIKRATYTTTTTANNASGIRSSAPIAWIGNAAGLGGFFFAARFGILTYTSTMQAWCSLSALSTALAAQPSATVNTFYMGKDSGETTWYYGVVNSGGTPNRTDTTRTTAAAGSAEVFDLYIYIKPNGSEATFRITDITTGTVLVDNVTISSGLPANTALLYAHCECRNTAGGASSNVAIFLNKIYIESDI